MPAIRTTVAAAGIIAATPGAAAVFGIDLNNRIDLGQLIIAISAIVSICALIFTMRADLRALKETLTKEMTELGGRVTKLEDGQSKIGEAMIQVARQDERLTRIDDQVRRTEDRVERLNEDLAWARRVPEATRARLTPNEPVIGRENQSY